MLVIKLFIQKVLVSLSSINTLLDDKKKTIIFYVESHSDYMFLDDIISQLLERVDFDIYYVTSSFDDPLLNRATPRLKVYYIKDGGILGYFFKKIQADIFLTTLTDLGSFYFKRSPGVKHCCYVFHSLNSAHMVYRKHAFTDYDHIFSAGPHLCREIKAMEQYYDWPEKELFNHGYGRLDKLLEQKKQYPAIDDHKVLIAPSWGVSGLIESGLAEKIITLLLEHNYTVVLQPHPMTIHKSSKQLQHLQEMFTSDKRFTINDNITNISAFFTSNHIITDWSGIGCEYAFTHKKPVCYINTESPKCRNEDYEAINIVPLEVSIRDKIGVIIQCDQLETLPIVLNNLGGNESYSVDKINSIMHATVFNVGNSGKIGVEYILNLLEK